MYWCHPRPVEAVVAIMAASSSTRGDWGFDLTTEIFMLPVRLTSAKFALNRASVGLSGNAFSQNVRFMATKPSPFKFTMDQAGLATDLYVPPAKTPNLITKPKLWWTVFKRKLQVLGVNTYMAVKLRREIGKDRFQPLEWKELAIILYKRTNESFVRRDFNNLQRLTSRWVYGPLSQRAKELSPGFRYDWKLISFKRRPQVISMVPLAMPNEPTRFVQVVYRFESKQQLSKVTLGSQDVERVERDVVDNIAFIFDTERDPPEGRLIGSLFETPATAPMPDPSMMPQSRSVVMHGMSVRGDIFRPQPEYAALKESS